MAANVGGPWSDCLEVGDEPACRVGAICAGLVATGQTEQYGISRVALGRLRDRGLIHQARQGVYSLPSATDGPCGTSMQRGSAPHPPNSASTGSTSQTQVIPHISAARANGLGDLVR